MRMNKTIYFFTLIFFTLISCGVRKSLENRPDLSTFQSKQYSRNEINDSLFYIENNFLKKNKTQNWELFVSGDPLEIGQKTGVLTKELYAFQEQSFMNLITDFIPSEKRRKFLFKVLKYYNRDLHKYVNNEYKAQIYGLSESANSRYDSLIDKYNRNLFLHGAHDIGHAMHDLMLVGCSSLAVWDNKSEDGGLLIGRNFDFYANDDFAKNKIVSFVKPNSGYPYMSVTWGGMIGVSSGMNLEGLTVTINAGKSSIPLKAKTPISLVALEVLQYASTIDEAVEIAKTKKVFVSESMMIGSAKDHRVVLIEISPKKFGVYEVQNQPYLACTNHFQSDVYLDDKRNNTQKEESHSVYRFEKIEEHLSNENKLNPTKMVDLLRDTNGLKNTKLGYGNEKALNQLLAHHAVVFQPDKRLVWVSSNPYQLGEFTAYDLNKIFNDSILNYTLNVDSLRIEKDMFVLSDDYSNYEKYREQTHEINKLIKENKKIEETFLTSYIQNNPDFWLVYDKVGDYYFQQKDYQQASFYYKLALTKEVTTVPDRNKIQKKLSKCSRKTR
ncbi:MULTISPECIES: C45 family autoproteolytic acyltransferase/hydolase [Empedobacter]|uniref:Acyl-CoA--6-aminopenicillanic acid acyl-transferase n=1 Tax=Empedobacter falsenii TaxID=343874 RepID=A0A7H9DUE3_9FLAO|nr:MULTISPECIES: C45 family peptidase [Empedobacter]MDH2206016.1 C45 family peptidase [Empedobacter sp. GD03644]QLL58695.1 acyl-CoA--6-aminopenicillanic acid acyl-transferase [Empedobacter falsenii]